MKPEFLLLPVLSYFSLLIVTKVERLKEKKSILFLSLIGILGAFLAKGANEPFGGLYFLAFDFIPGFSLFRDPTKWYVLIAISYSMLIPFGISEVYNFLKKSRYFSFLNSKFAFFFDVINLQNLFLLLVFSYLFFIIKPAWVGNLSGTFEKTLILPKF